MIQVRFLSGAPSNQWVTWHFFPRSTRVRPCRRYAGAIPPFSNCFTRRRSASSRPRRASRHSCAASAVSCSQNSLLHGDMRQIPIKRPPLRRPFLCIHGGAGPVVPRAPLLGEPVERLGGCSSPYHTNFRTGIRSNPICPIWSDQFSITKMPCQIGFYEEDLSDRRHSS